MVGTVFKEAGPPPDQSVSSNIISSFAIIKTLPLPNFPIIPLLPSNKAHTMHFTKTIALAGACASLAIAAPAAQPDSVIGSAGTLVSGTTATLDETTSELSNAIGVDELNADVAALVNKRDTVVGAVDTLISGVATTLNASSTELLNAIGVQDLGAFVNATTSTAEDNTDSALSAVETLLAGIGATVGKTTVQLLNALGIKDLQLYLGANLGRRSVPVSKRDTVVGAVDTLIDGVAASLNSSSSELLGAIGISDLGALVNATTSVATDETASAVSAATALLNGIGATVGKTAQQLLSAIGVKDLKVYLGASLQ